jgi:cytochrome b pre-mRNA-processing protein 3
MVFRLFRRDPQAATIAALYGAIVAQARIPAFYLAYGVPDTPEGRFDMVVLHLALLCVRLRREGETAQTLSQGVFDMFCRDMDHNLREMGISDVRVPKTMRKLAEAFYGRLDAYDRALAADGDEALVDVLSRNVLGGATEAAPRLARYARAATQEIAAAPMTDVRAGRLTFPDPEKFAASVPIPKFANPCGNL